MQRRIDELDAAIIRLWQERAELSQEIGAIRVAAGDPRLFHGSVPSDLASAPDALRRPVR
jgi:chorismate mutase